MRVLKRYTAILARFFLSLPFLAGAVHKIFHWQEVEKSLTATLCDWQALVRFSDTAQDCLLSLTPWAPLLLIAATLFELVGGLLLLLAIHEKLGALLLILFLIPVTIFYHPFWAIEPGLRELQATMFVKNLAILGGLFFVMLNGARSKDNMPTLSFGP